MLLSAVKVIPRQERNLELLRNSLLFIKSPTGSLSWDATTDSPPHICILSRVTQQRFAPNSACLDASRVLARI